MYKYFYFLVKGRYFSPQRSLSKSARSLLASLFIERSEQPLKSRRVVEWKVLLPVRHVYVYSIYSHWSLRVGCCCCCKVVVGCLAQPNFTVIGYSRFILYTH